MVSLNGEQTEFGIEEFEVWQLVNDE